MASTSATIPTTVPVGTKRPLDDQDSNSGTPCTTKNSDASIETTKKFRTEPDVVEEATTTITTSADITATSTTTAKSATTTATSATTTAPSETKTTTSETTTATSETTTTTSTLETQTTTTSVEKVRRPKKHCYAFLLSYCGAKYLGMQINHDFPTIELKLFQALRDSQLITLEEYNMPPSAGLRFQRAARTDKGVSAVRQLCSVHLSFDPKEDLQKYRSMINEKLPAEIRLMGIKRATNSFNAKNKADSRTYHYTMPTFALAPVETVVDHTYRFGQEQEQSDKIIDQVNDVLGIYVGTHNFYNFTSKRQHSDASCNRLIHSFTCGKPYILDDFEMVTMTVHGQSFMLHQIRKMIGLCIAIVRGVLEKSIMQKAWEAERLDIPIAPGLGLMLGKVHYASYDRKFAKTHNKLDDWPECDAAIEQFKRDFIDREIVDREKLDHSFLSWLSQLHEPDNNWGKPNRSQEQRQKSASFVNKEDDEEEEEADS